MKVNLVHELFSETFNHFYNTKIFSYNILSFQIFKITKKIILSSFAPINIDKFESSILCNKVGSPLISLLYTSRSLQAPR